MTTHTTAEQLITDSLGRALESLGRIYDSATGRIDSDAVSSLVRHFDAVVLTEALRRRDSAKADRIALAGLSGGETLAALREVDPAAADRISERLEGLHQDGDAACELIPQWREQISRGHQMTGIDPDIEQPGPPAGAHPFPLRHREDGPPMDVLAVPSTVPGLIVTQAVTGGYELGEYTVIPGRWDITHTGSAHVLAGVRYPLDVAQQIIVHLGATGLDWTRPAESLIKDDDGVRSHIAAITEAFASFSGCRYCADADHLPVAPWRTPADPRIAAGALADTLTGFQYRWSSERDLQDGIEQVLTAAGHQVQREVSVTPQDRIDLLVGRVAIEVKVKGGAEEVARQVQRYSHSEHIDAVVLATTKAAHRDMPEQLGGVPLVVAYLTHIA